ncbi:MAG: T9SS type A sorting domain-containing protein [Saprospiraceae bacterium]
MKLQFVFFIYACVATLRLSAQCTPASANRCENVNVLCNVNELNGYHCTSPDWPNPTGCTPLCPSGGMPSRTMWWAFVAHGGEVCVTLDVASCQLPGQGLEFGLTSDCQCSEILFCDARCTGPGSKTACAVLKPCTTYYLFVDACSDDVCDFTITTKGDETDITEISQLTGPRSVCQGSCQIEYAAETNLDYHCESDFIWTLDGTDLDQYKGRIKLDFPDEGKFILCATAIIGNPGSVSICDQIGPRCITIGVHNGRTEGMDSLRLICRSQLPFRWGNKLIDSAGTYRQTYYDSNCCVTDSTVHFVITGKGRNEISFLGCKGDQFTDPYSGRVISYCLDTIIFLSQDSTPADQCDSSYRLRVGILDYKLSIASECIDEQLFYYAHQNLYASGCTNFNVKSDHVIWYKKSDHIILSQTNELEVKTADEYCADISFIMYNNIQQKEVHATLCDSFDEDFLIHPKCPEGLTEVLVGDTSVYSISPPWKSGYTYGWMAEGGEVISDDPYNRHVRVVWKREPGSGQNIIGHICAVSGYVCNMDEKECCREVKIKRPTNVHEDNKLISVVIVPNPVNINFRILSERNTVFSSVQFVTITGLIIQEYHQVIAGTEVRICGMIPGVYFVRMNAGNEILVRRVMVAGE